MTVCKKTVSVLIMTILACAYSVSATPTCLYCLRSAETATLLDKYSYCTATDVCLENKWDYIDYPCNGSKWENAKKIPFDNCNATETTCHQFTSSSS